LPTCRQPPCRDCGARQRLKCVLAPCLWAMNLALRKDHRIASCMSRGLRFHSTYGTF